FFRIGQGGSSIRIFFEILRKYTFGIHIFLSGFQVILQFFHGIDLFVFIDKPKSPVLAIRYQDKGFLAGVPALFGDKNIPVPFPDRSDGTYYFFVIGLFGFFSPTDAFTAVQVVMGTAWGIFLKMAEFGT